MNNFIKLCRSILLLACGCGWTLGSVGAEDWQPSRELLAAVRFVESSNGRFVVGDEGRSLGDFQISRGAWEDVNEWRQRRRLKLYDYEEFVMHGFINRVYASNYLSILHARLSGRLGVEPSVEQLYAAYNMGFEAFASCDFRLDRVNQTTARRCSWIAETVSGR